MATEVRVRRGTTAQHETFTGAEGELTVDMDKDTVVVHDGTTAGGVPLAKEEELAAEVAEREADVSMLDTRITDEKLDAVDTSLAFSIALG